MKKTEGKRLERHLQISKIRVIHKFYLVCVMCIAVMGFVLFDRSTHSPYVNVRVCAITNIKRIELASLTMNDTSKSYGQENQLIIIRMLSNYAIYLIEFKA